LLMPGFTSVNGIFKVREKLEKKVKEARKN
jgi:hypothetical protein